MEAPRFLLLARCGTFVVTTILWGFLETGLLLVGTGVLPSAKGIDPDSMAAAVDLANRAALAFLLTTPLSWYLVSGRALKHRGQTRVMKWFGLKLTDNQGATPSWGRILLRTFLWNLLVVSVIGWVFIVVALFSRSGATAWDRLSGTRVVRADG